MGGSRIMLKGKVALITGGGQGIGRATALRLARDGARVVVVDVNPESARAVADEVSALGVEAMAAQLDVTNLAQVQDLVETVVGKLGRIDILVQCAGIVQMKRLMEVSEAEWERVFAVNTKGLFFTLQAVAKQMIRQGGGSIVNLSSISAQGPRPIQSPYAASKAAVLSITWSAAAALAPHGIRVNAVSPGVVETPMWEQIDREMATEFKQPFGEYRQGRLSQVPLGRFQTPEDIANAIAFLVGPEATEITGQTINVDGGFFMH
jgi:acetoin reductase-like protein